MIGHTTDPAPAPIASKEPEKGERYFGLYLLVGGLKPYDMESDIETTTALAKTHQLYRCPATMGNDWGSSCHGYTDRGRVERGIERELYFTEPPDFHIFLLYPPVSAGGESATFPRMFSSSARRF